MPLTRRTWLAGCFAALAQAAVSRPVAAQTAAIPGSITPAQMRDDLVFLQANWATRDLSFTEQQSLLLQQSLAEAASNVALSSMPDFALDIMKAVAISRNGHTAAMVGNLLGDLPVRFWWFADGLYVLSAHPSQASLLGARIEKLGELSPEEALTRVSPYISGTDQRIRYISASYLSSPTVLRRIGATKDISSTPIVFRLRDGRSQAVALAPTATPDPGDPHNPVFSGWSVLIPDGKDVPGRWRHILDALEKRPIGYARPTDFSTAWLGNDSQVLYIRSNRTVSEGEDRLDEKLLFVALQKQVVPKQPHSVVIDLRFNNGGNFFNSLLFAQALPKVMPASGRIFVLISRATFSAAIVTVAMLKGAGGNRVTLIGEPMGDDGRFWAEPEIITLPNSKIAVSASTKLEDYEAGCRDLQKCYWATTAFGPRNISLKPDIVTELTFDDYAAGHDRVLEKALSLSS